MAGGRAEDKQILSGKNPRGIDFTLNMAAWDWRARRGAMDLSVPAYRVRQVPPSADAVCSSRVHCGNQGSGAAWAGMSLSALELTDLKGDSLTVSSAVTVPCRGRVCEVTHPSGLAARTEQFRGGRRGRLEKPKAPPLPEGWCLML